MNAWPIVVVLIPLGCAFLTAFARRILPRAARVLPGVGALAHVGAVGVLVGQVVRDGPLLVRLGGWAPPLGIVLVADEVAVAFLLIVSLGMLFSSLHLLATTWQEAGHLGMLLSLLSAAASGWVLTGDVFNLFVFMELTSVVCIGLVAFRRDGVSAVHAFVYLLFATFSGVFLLLAVAFLYSATGTLNLAHLYAMAPDLPARTVGMAGACVVLSFGIKIGMVPLHIWKPGVYAAAGSAASAVFSGVVMSCAVYGLARVSAVVIAAGGSPARLLAPFLLGAGCVNVLVGHGMALVQRDLTRMLTFSSVAHVGYVLIGLGLGTAAGMAAAVLHTFHHMLMKMGAFYSAGLLRESCGSDSLSRLRGAAYVAPVSMALFFFSALALVGVPPTHGFIGKWWLARASLAQGQWIPVLVMAVGTAVSLSYYARVFAIALRPVSRPACARPRWAASAVVALPVLGGLILGFLVGHAAPKLEAAAHRLTDPGAYVRLVFPEAP